MKPKIFKPTKKTTKAKTPPHDGKTRAPEAALDEGSAEAFRAVEPEGFKDHARSSIEAAVVDPDVDDSEGGE
jgi:hypothetical protein